MPFSALLLATLISITGTVVDPSGGAVPGATVSLHGSSTTTDNLGHFHFDNVAPGRSRIEVTADSFKPLRRDATIAPGMAPLVLQLSLPTVEESVEVTADDVRPTVDTAANLDTTTLSGSTLD
ncbi:MAG: Carboxypeptidase regulatory-like domain, partial [Thermoanaerobaculia bacterium]|nr:Carboxypeptidase regulatory-like domain [Thermoanaerobaculia bacterium]